MSRSASRQLWYQLTSLNMRVRSAPRQPLRRTGLTFAIFVVSSGSAWLGVQAVQDIDIIHYAKSRWFLHADAATDPSHITQTASRVDPETSMSFPLYLTPTTKVPNLTLVGLGVRKVSFLRVKVYSAGFYLEERIAQHLDDIPGWHSFTAQHLQTPPTAAPSDPLGAPQMSGEALMRVLLEQGAACAVMIIPVRNTDFSHLRDGFTRALLARQKLARANAEIYEVDEKRIADSLQTFKSLFPSQSVPKGHSLVLLRSTDGSLHVEFEGRVLGSVQDPWVAQEMMLAYFADKDVISPKLKEDVAKGLEDLRRR